MFHKNTSVSVNTFQKKCVVILKIEDIMALAVGGKCNSTSDIR